MHHQNGLKTEAISKLKSVTSTEAAKGKPRRPEITRRTLSITVGLIIKYHVCIIKNPAQVRCCSPPWLLASNHRTARTSGPLVPPEGAEGCLSMKHQLNPSIAHFALITSSYIQTAFGQLQQHSGELSASSLVRRAGSFPSSAACLTADETCIIITWSSIIKPPASLLNIVNYFWTVAELRQPMPDRAHRQSQWCLALTGTVSDQMSCTLRVDPHIESVADRMEIYM